MNKIKRIASVVLLLMSLCAFTACTGIRSGETPKEDLNTIKIIAHCGSSSEIIDYWDSREGCFYYFLPSSADPKALTVGTQNGITLRKQDQNVMERRGFKDGDRLEDIEIGETYMLGCYDQNLYLYEVPVRFVKSQNVPSIFIHTSTGDIQPVVDNKANRVSGTISINNADGSQRCRQELDYIKGRGNASQYFHKRPFNLKLSEPADLLGTGISDHYCLLSQELDVSFIRNKLAFDIAREVGLPFTPGNEFAELWIDGTYWGLYLFTNAVEVSPASVDIQDLSSMTAQVNTQKLSSYPKAESAPGTIYSQIPNDPQDISGGYLLEVDKYYHMNKENRFNGETFKGITLKSPSRISKAQMNYIKPVILDMEQAILDRSSKDYLSHIDLDSWVRMGVLQELMVNSDFMGSSQYFFKDADKNGEISPVFAGPIWDMDHSLEAFRPNVLMMNRKAWYTYLYNRPEFREEVEQVYKNVFRPVITALDQGGMDALTAEIDSAAKMNNLRWQRENSVYKNGTMSLEEAMVSLKEYWNERVRFLDDLWINNVRFHPVHVTQATAPASTYYYVDYLVREGETFLPPPDPSNQNLVFVGWFYGDPGNPGDPVDTEKPVTEQQYVFAKYRPMTPEEIAAAQPPAEEGAQK